MTGGESLASEVGEWWLLGPADVGGVGRRVASRATRVGLVVVVTPGQRGRMVSRSLVPLAGQDRLAWVLGGDRVVLAEEIALPVAAAHVSDEDT